MRVCTIEDCEKTHDSKGYCGMHYARWKKSGNPGEAAPQRNRNHGPTCKIDGCEKEHSAQGWCPTHYGRWKSHGDPNHTPFSTPRKVTPPEQRFAAKWIPDPDTGCHQWTGALHNGGYGSFSTNGKQVAAHRYAWEQVNGPIPEGMYIDHLCRNRACVNADHLRVVTPRQNILENSNSLQATNARKTHCLRGHPLSDTNIRITTTGSRQCLRCMRFHNAKNRARQRHRTLIAQHAPLCPAYQPTETSITI